MRTSFHHQPEAQHPNSSAVHKLVGRLTHLLGVKRTLRGRPRLVDVKRLTQSGHRPPFLLRCTPARILGRKHCRPAFMEAIRREPYFGTVGASANGVLQGVPRLISGDTLIACKERGCENRQGYAGGSLK